MMENNDRKVIPEDLFFEILKDVPAKSLLRFRCVCKLWCSLIDDSNFVHSHRARSCSRLDATHLLLVIERYFPYVVSVYSINPDGQSAPTQIDSLTLHQTLAVQDICYVNGLINFGNCIYNPSTQGKILLDPPVTGDRNGFFFLGFDHCTKLYKVLAIINFYSEAAEPQYIFNVLTLGTNSWRIVEGPVSILPHRGCIVPKKIVYSNCANGVVFFLTWNLSNLSQFPRLHAFEIGDEKFRVIALPQNFLSISTPRYDRFHLQIVDDCPAVFISDNDMMTMWILEDYAKQIWKREDIQYPHQWQHNGHIQLPQERWPGREIITTPIGTIQKNKILFRSERKWSAYRKSSFFYYDMQCKTSMAIPQEIFQVLETRLSYAAKHVETLFKLKD